MLPMPTLLSAVLRRSQHPRIDQRGESARPISPIPMAITLKSIASYLLANQHYWVLQIREHLPGCFPWFDDRSASHKSRGDHDPGIEAFLTIPAQEAACHKQLQTGDTPH